MAALKDANTFTQDDLAESPMNPSADPSLWGVVDSYGYFVETSYPIGVFYYTEETTAVVEDTRIFPRVPRERVTP